MREYVYHLPAGGPLEDLIDEISGTASTVSVLRDGDPVAVIVDPEWWDEIQVRMREAEQKLAQIERLTRG